MGHSRTMKNQRVAFRSSFCSPWPGFESHPASVENSRKPDGCGSEFITACRALWGPPLVTPGYSDFHVIEVDAWMKFDHNNSDENFAFTFAGRKWYGDRGVGADCRTGNRRLGAHACRYRGLATGAVRIAPDRPRCLASASARYDNIMPRMSKRRHLELQLAYLHSSI